MPLCHWEIGAPHFERPLCLSKCWAPVTQIPHPGSVGTSRFIVSPSFAKCGAELMQDCNATCAVLLPVQSE